MEDEVKYKPKNKYQLIRNVNKATEDEWYEIIKNGEVISKVYTTSVNEALWSFNKAIAETEIEQIIIKEIII